MAQVTFEVCLCVCVCVCAKTTYTVYTCPNCKTIHTPSHTQERCEECDGDEKRIVVRDATKWGALDKLPSTFPTRLADRLYTGLSNGFRVCVGVGMCVGMCGYVCDCV